MTGRKSIYLVFGVAASILLTFGCKEYDNFTTYFNTYYNAKRILWECEDEFDYQSDMKRKKPRVIVPRPEIYFNAENTTGPPEFMKEFIVTQQMRQPVGVKLDSIEIKGSKILANHSKSDYIEGTLFLMAKGYFYRNDWLPSQIKCSELIDKYPGGDWSPDAHLLMSKNYLIQKKFYEGKILLSRTVDIAWQKERYDILSEAFRLEADLAMYEGDEEEALRPYRQAIAQTDDGKMKALWQLEMGNILFTAGRFEKAEKMYLLVSNYSPDYVAEFEAKLYRASSLARLERYEESVDILDELESDGKFEEWQASVFAERMNLWRLQGMKDDIEKAEVFADSAFVGSPALMGAYFEMGIEHFEKKDYLKARPYFARAKITRSPIFETAQRLYFLINEWDRNKTQAYPVLQKIDKGEVVDDTTKMKLATNLFELGRIHEHLGNPDSAFVFFEAAVKHSPEWDHNAPRYLYAYSRVLKENNPRKSDSLLDVIVIKYPFTEFGVDARKKLGYEDSFVIDSVAELYESGNRLRKFGEYYFAIQQFSILFQKFPQSDYAPKSIYSIGWIYEKNLQNPDSAMYYYEMLLRDYPYSEYAADVLLSVAYFKALAAGEELPDSLNKKFATVPKKGEEPIKKNQFNQKQNEKSDPNENPIDINNIQDAPGNLFNKAKESIGNPLDLIKGMKLENPFDMFAPNNDENENTDVPDTTKKVLEPLK